MPGDNPDKAPRGPTTAKQGASDFFQMAVAYAKQETLDPVLAQLKAMAKGVAGAFLLALGTVLLAVGFVRALQSELGSSNVSTPRLVLSRAGPYGAGNHLSGDWSWVPYMGGALLCVLVAAFCTVRALKGGRS